MGMMLSYAPLLLILVVFYFLILRPQMTQSKLHAALLAGLKEGDAVLVGAVFGRVKSVKETTVTVQVAEGVTMTVLKVAVTRKLSEDEARLLVGASPLLANAKTTEVFAAQYERQGSSHGSRSGQKQKR